MKIAIDDKCQEEFNFMKFDKKYRYMIFKVATEETEKIVVGG